MVARARATETFGVDLMIGMSVVGLMIDLDHVVDLTIVLTTVMDVVVLMTRASPIAINTVPDLMMITTAIAEKTRKRILQL